MENHLINDSGDANVKPGAGTDTPFSYALCNNIYQCFIEAGAFAGNTKPDPSLLKNLNNWSSGKHKPTLKSIAKIPDFSEAIKQIFIASTITSKEQNNDAPCSSMILYWPGFQGWVFTEQELFFSYYALLINQISYQILCTREPPSESSLLLPSYLQRLTAWRKSPDNASSFFLRLESLIYIIAIREAGSEPCNRMITEVCNWRKDNPKPSYQEAFWKKYKMSRFTIWRHIAEREWEKRHPGIQTSPSTADLDDSYSKQGFYRRLNEQLDEPLLDEVFDIYHDLVLKRPATSETKAIIVYTLKRTVSLLHVLDWLITKGRPKDVSEADVTETIGRLEYYMNYVIGYKDNHPLPESACELYNCLYDMYSTKADSTASSKVTQDKQ